MDGCHNVSASTNLGCRRCKSFGRLTNNSTECHAKDYGDDCSSDPVQSTNHEGGWPLLVGAHPRCPSIRPSRVFVAGNNRHHPLEREAAVQQRDGKSIWKTPDSHAVHLFLNSEENGTDLGSTTMERYRSGPTDIIGLRLHRR